MITRADVADRLGAFLVHRLELTELVDWAENVLMGDAPLDPADAEVIADALAHIGLADVREFGLTWPEIDELLERLGYRSEVRVYPAG